MAIDKKNYPEKVEELRKLGEEMDKLRGTEDATVRGSKTRTRVREMMQEFGEKQQELFEFEVQMGMRPEGAFVTTQEIR